MEFNIALAKQQYGQLIYAQNVDQYSISDLKRAVELVEEAQAEFLRLKEIGNRDPKSLQYDVKMASEREKYCGFVKNNLKKRIVQREANDEMQKERLDLLKKKREEEMLMKKKIMEENENLKREQEHQLMLERAKMQEDIISHQILINERVAASRDDDETKVSTKICCLIYRRNARERTKILLLVTMKPNMKLLQKLARRK